MRFPEQTPRADFMGNPIVFTLSELPMQPNTSHPISFHQVHLVVDIACDGAPVASYTLSQTFAGTIRQSFDFDISSCFRAAAAFYTLTPVTSQARQFPTYTASVHAYSSYMQDGVQHTTIDLFPGGSNEDGNIIVGNTRFMLATHMGRYSDFERLQSADSASLVTSFTRKPVASPEVVFPGDTILYACLTAAGSSGSPSGGDSAPVEVKSIPTTAIHTVPEGSPEGSIVLEGHQYYVTRRRRRSVLFQFLNSRGCIETIRAFAHHAEKANMSLTEHTISRFERFSQFSRNLIQKQLRPSEFSLTSGPVDYQWARWWLYEFCTSQHVWMLVDKYNPLAQQFGYTSFVQQGSSQSSQQAGSQSSQQPSSDAASTPIWLPVNIKPSESATLIDFAKTDLLSVDFTVLPDMNGPLF